MNGFAAMAQLQINLFLLMSVGFLLRKKDFAAQGVHQILTKLLINVFLPCNIITSFQIKLTAGLAGEMLITLAVPFGIYTVCCLLNKFLFARADENRKSVLRYGILISNASFMGNPIAEAIYGTRGLFYASISLIPLRIFMWSAGLALFVRTDWKDGLKKVAAHPCIIAVYIGLLKIFLGLSLPGFIDNTLLQLGRCTTPVSMMVVGMILAEAPLRFRIDRDMLVFCLFRHLLIPLAVLLALCILGIPPLIIGVSVVLSGMPAGSTTAILASTYGADTVYASRLTFVSTVVSFFFMPLLSAVLHYALAT